MSMTSRMLLSRTRTMMKPSRSFCMSNVVMSKNVAPGTVWADKHKVPYLFGLTPLDPDDPVRKYVSSPALEMFGRVVLFFATLGAISTGLIIYWEYTETYVDGLKRQHGILPPKK